jgi:EmrB/QacA subfamily drug resistance transporter
MDSTGVTTTEDVPARIHLVMIAVVSGMYLAAVDGTIVNTALPTIVGDLGNLSRAPWIVVGYLMTQTIATPIVGKLSDIFGRRKTYQASIALFVLASLLAATSQSLIQLVAYRALQGIGAGGLLSLPMAIVGDLLPPTERARYQGYIAATFAVAVATGPLFGGLIVDHFSWRWIFFVNLPIGGASMLAVQKLLHITRAPTRRSIDIVGALVLSAAVAPLIVALLWSGERYGWGSPTTLGLIAVSVVFTILFIVVEQHVTEPIMPLWLFSDKVVRLACIGGFVIGIGMYAVNAYVPLFLQVVRGASSTASGLLTVPNAVAITVASIVSGRLIKRFGNYRPYPLLGCALLALSAYLLSSMGTGASRFDVALRLAIGGLGMGQLGPSMVLIVQNAVQYKDLGVATAGLAFLRSLGGVMGSAALGAVYSNRVETLIPRYVGADALATVPDVDALQGRPRVIRALDEPIRSQVIRAFSDSITTAVRWAIPAVFVGFIVFLFLPNIPLRSRLDTPRAPEPDEELAASPSPA